MSAAKHTPGPWAKGRSTGVLQVFNAEGRMVCDVLTTTADGNLITAAPELLSACQGLRESAETGVTSLGVLRAARAAIAKATGSAS